MNFIRIIAVSCAAFVLAGCFVSEEPFITPETGVRVFEPGAYTAFSLDEDGSYSDEEPWQGDVVWREGYLHSDVEEMPLQGAVFREIAPDIYVAMGWAREEGDEDEPFVYVLVFTYPDGRMGVLMPLCENLSEETLDTLGLIEESGTCHLDDFDHLSKVMLTYLEAAEEPVAVSTIFQRDE